MQPHAAIIVVCDECSAALAGLTARRTVVWHRSELTSTQAHFADANALVTPEKVLFRDLPASAIAKMSLTDCGRCEVERAERRAVQNDWERIAKRLDSDAARAYDRPLISRTLVSPVGMIAGGHIYKSRVK